ncbi:MAG TPA: DUF4910 domain-containing protein, partial [Gemmatimonadaceae bacterium]|nr:DUF4910 domain-containing protein [Gemmatimonadaceae bacterium]
AAELLGDVPPTCFGRGSVFDRLRRAGGKICMLGIGLYEASFQHHVEEMVGVPFRFRKLFTGVIRDGAAVKKTGWLYNVRIMAENSIPDDSRLEELARAAGLCRAAAVGQGEVLCVESGAYYDLIANALAKDPWFTARGPAGNPVALEEARVGAPRIEVRLPSDASAAVLTEALWRIPRDIVSDGYDASLRALGTQLPMTVHDIPTGSECWSWIVPEKWRCREAYLERLDGTRLFSYADHPLHVVSYSLPFEGEVSRETLFAHLHVHHQLSDAVPFIFKYYERDWGLCCSKEMRDTLTDDRYRVVIRTDFSYGTLKVGEVVAPGASDDTIVLCAHLCHPGMFNDDLSGIIVGVEVMRELLRRKNRHYTYRFLIVPETIGSVAYLSRHEELVPHFKGGLFLEMLGLDQPHALQLSFDGHTEIDECFTQALRAADPFGWTGAFRTVIGNDERQFNAPGIRVPMLSLSRVLPMSHADAPYRGYHSNRDTPTLGSPRRLTESSQLVLKMLDTLEGNVIPVNKFKGEVFCSRYGIEIDWWTNRRGYEALFDIMFLIDGTRSITEIASQCNVPFEDARATIEELRRHGLVTTTRRDTRSA